MLRILSRVHQGVHADSMHLLPACGGRSRSYHECDACGYRYNIRRTALAKACTDYMVNPPAPACPSPSPSPPAPQPPSEDRRSRRVGRGKPGLNGPREARAEWAAGSP